MVYHMCNMTVCVCGMAWLYTGEWNVQGLFWGVSRKVSGISPLAGLTAGSAKCTRRSTSMTWPGVLIAVRRLNWLGAPVGAAMNTGQGVITRISRVS